MFNIYDENRKKIELPQGVIPLDIFISSISRQRQANQIEGRFGSVNYGVVDDYRTVDLYILLRSHDTADYRLLRDELYELFGRDFLYVEEMRARGKLYKISVDSSYIPDRAPKHARDASVMIPGVTIDMPFAESIGTTSLIDQNGISANDELWGFGMGLIDSDEMKYTFINDQYPWVYNAGSVRVHPFQQDFKLRLVAKSDSEREGEPHARLRIYNRTTDEYFQVDDYIKSGDVIEIDGPIVKINGLNALRKTSKDWFTLAPGWNEFVIYYLTDFELTFDFRFYYL